MPQSQLTQYYGAVRGGHHPGAVLSSNCTVASDDDAPMVVNLHIKTAPAGFSRSTDGRVVVTKRSRYEGEASECSELADDSSASDSFVVSDHASDVNGSSSPEAQDSLREICQCLRNRKQFIHCPQCLRLVRIILRFLADVVENMPDS